MRLVFHIPILISLSMRQAVVVTPVSLTADRWPTPPQVACSAQCLLARISFTYGSLAIGPSPAAQQHDMCLQHHHAVLPSCSLQTWLERNNNTRKPSKT
jgi:hypothetical protein